jgi:hemerythrin-like domain-containing protein
MLAEFLTSDHRHCDEAFVGAEEAVARRDWESASAALREFADATERHLRREEDLLFPAFEAATGMTSGPTAVMRSEHAHMRRLLSSLEQALVARDRDEFLGAAETLLMLMQQHNAKEESILYPMADRVLHARAEALLRQIEAG